MVSGVGSVLLIVVDKRETRALFNQALKSSAYRMTFATDGEDGFDRFGESKPDLVITHTSTPKIDGTILIQLIRQQPGGKKVPVVLVSEELDEATGPSRARGVDADGWLPLPFTRTRLLEVIDRLIKSGRAAEEELSEADTGEHVIAETPLLKRKDPASSTDPDFHITLDEEDSEGLPLVAQPGIEAHDEDDIDTGQTPAPGMDDVEEVANATVINELPDEVSLAVAKRAAPPAKPAVPSISDLDAPIPIDLEGFDEPAPPAPAPALKPAPIVEPPLPNVKAPRAPTAMGPGGAPRPPGLAPLSADPASMLDEMPLPTRSNRPSRFEPTSAGRTPTNERIIREPKLDVTPTPDFAPTAPPRELAQSIANNNHGLDESRLGKRLVKSVQQISKLLDELDYYQLFDLEPSASAKEIRDKYFDKCIEFHPDRFFLIRSGDVKEKLYRIYRRLNEAYAVLSDERRRPKYDELLRSKTAKRMPPEERHTKRSEPAPDPGRPAPMVVSTNPSAQRLVEIARAAYDQTDLNSARLFLTFAAVYDPENENIRRSLGEVAHARRRAF